MRNITFPTRELSDDGTSIRESRSRDDIAAQIARNSISPRPRKDLPNVSENEQPGNGSVFNDMPENPFAVPQHIGSVSLHSDVSISTLQEWEGYVTEIGKDYFSADLVDISADDSEVSETATFPISDVQEEDIDLFKAGAPFRWTIGYARHLGTRMRFSQIVFRRRPKWTKFDLIKSAAKAEEVMKSLKVE